MESYTYLHCKPDGTPFYVGKGTLRRAKYLGERNSYHQATVAKYGKSNILIGMLDCSSSDIAYNLERGLIKCLKRMNIRLTNFTEGGEGGVNPCPETRKRLSEAAKKRGVSEVCQRAKVLAKKGKPLSPEQKAKQSASMKGIVFTEEHRKNISESAKKRGISEAVRLASKLSNKGRIQPKDERERRGNAIRKTLETTGKTTRVKVGDIEYISLAEAARQNGVCAAFVLYALRHSGYIKGKKVEAVK